MYSGEFVVEFIAKVSVEQNCVETSGSPTRPGPSQNPAPVSVEQNRVETLSETPYRMTDRSIHVSVEQDCVETTQAWCLSLPSPPLG